MKARMKARIDAIFSAQTSVRRHPRRCARRPRRARSWWDHAGDEAATAHRDVVPAVILRDLEKPSRAAAMSSGKRSCAIPVSLYLFFNLPAATIGGAQV